MRQCNTFGYVNVNQRIIDKSFR